MHDKIWRTREKAYMDTIKKYNSREIELFCKMQGLLWQSFQEYGIYDYLGEIYMRSGAGSKSTGQFFTPFHISELCAKVRLKSVEKEEKIKMLEPSAGGGGLILATAKVLYDNGINYQKYLDVVARDLDWNGVYMTYIQLSMIGIKAVVIQGDALAKSERNCNVERMLVTPAKIGAIL
nr:MAG TPA: type I restriction system adenine methylase [Caudoviricetes sp.]